MGKDHFGGTKKDTGKYKEMRSLHPFFSADPKENPLLYDANWVFMRYCDGGYFSGDVSHPVKVEGSSIFFRGRAIRAAMIDSLAHHCGMHDALEVLFSGCS